MHVKHVLVFLSVCECNFIENVQNKRKKKLLRLYYVTRVPRGGQGMWSRDFTEVENKMASQGGGDQGTGQASAQIHHQISGDRFPVCVVNVGNLTD